ncbi:MarR family winged helix-turn-helix transcriptional regulator [Microbacterium hatanonis]|jgi:DNA-binding MarR family transcriptional regulator|uniref:MarR family transcriptional regulator n=1 Tax=Microbacterium hatanonis TaxID=404366 RepID=A0A5C8I3U4_9MICO|nr:MarR family transcriptional regulator [Microbacterium hatanonis]TXK13712.1 MarR family transcriptional regulator [Microbacterium hatanonis]
MHSADAQRSAFASLLRELHDATVQAGFATARRMELSTTDAAAIEHIVLAAAPIGPAELSVRLGVTRSSATEIIDRLVRSGRMERRRDEVDGRRFRLVPTDAARELVSTELSPLERRVEEVGASFTPQQQGVIAEFLEAVATAHREFAVGETPAG